MKTALEVINQLQAKALTLPADEQMRKILESKRAMRKQLAALPFSDKVKLPEKLHDRALAIAASPLKQRSTRRG